MKETPLAASTSSQSPYGALMNFLFVHLFALARRRSCRLLLSSLSWHRRRVAVHAACFSMAASIRRRRFLLNNGRVSLACALTRLATLPLVLREFMNASPTEETNLAAAVDQRHLFYGLVLSRLESCCCGGWLWLTLVVSTHLHSMKENLIPLFKWELIVGPTCEHFLFRDSCCSTNFSECQI